MAARGIIDENLTSPMAIAGVKRYLLGPQGLIRKPGDISVVRVSWRLWIEAASPARTGVSRRES
jgi:hypothetical protein